MTAGSTPGLVVDEGNDEESMEDAEKCELLEETGYEAAEMKPLFRFDEGT